MDTSPVSWTAKKQKLVTLSSTEAEFIALCDVPQEISTMDTTFGGKLQNKRSKREYCYS